MSREQFEQHRTQVTSLYQKLYTELHTMKLALVENPRLHSLEELVDIGWSMKQCEKLLDELRKRYVEIREKTIETIVCARWVDDNQNTIGKAQPIRGELTTGTPNIGEMHTTPKSGTPEFLDLMHELGVPQGNESMFRLHWPTLVKLVTERKAQGKPIPKVLADVDKTFPVFSVKYYSRHNQKKETENGDDRHDKSGTECTVG